MTTLIALGIYAFMAASFHLATYIINPTDELPAGRIIASLFWPVCLMAALITRVMCTRTR